jgi:4'-phosphopantetheinyl transferase EntD
VFSAKESVYKCVATATGKCLRFADVSLSLNLARSEFEAHLCLPLPRGWPPVLHGRVGRSREHLFCGLWWPPTLTPE